MYRLMVRSYDSPLRAAVKTNNLTEIQKLLEESDDINDDIGQKDKYGHNALHLAALHEDHRALELLLNAKPNKKIVNAGDEYDNKPIHFAVREGCVRSIELLLDHGADIDAMNPKEQMAIHLAAKDNKFDAAKLLVDRGAELECGDTEYNTPMLLAVKNQSKEIAKLLWDNKVRDSDIPFLIIRNYAYLDIFKLFLENSTPEDMYEYLDLSIRWERKKIIELVFQKFLLAIEHEIFKFTTPLIKAAERKNYGIVELCIKNGANVNAKNSQGKTSIDFLMDDSSEKAMESVAVILSTGVAQLTEQNIEFYVKNFEVLLQADYGLLAGAYIFSHISHHYDSQKHIVDDLALKLSGESKKMSDYYKQREIPQEIDHKLFFYLNDYILSVNRSKLILKQTNPLVYNPLSSLLPQIESLKQTLTNKVTNAISTNFIELPENKLHKICQGIFLQDVLNYFACPKDSTTSVNKGFKDILCELFSYFGPKDLEEFYKISQGSMYKEEDTEHEAKRVKLETEDVKTSGELLTDQVA
ncbi:hypothetical protein phytr_11310 [Candidatus Phycorickettsia trachydisci]|uniref:Ankyrin repeat-containing protein n=1 Tax=Candidatus Phycorickettsia trachydisci TaxID=2115978 RepID=A0A2P1P9Y6_9RICK|nr:ankyrin repeat domain-containing protein [Candidatus Phycorickettsia trachydisci]AVP88056.1 hypothetical protein phytr_11310 [Candidatus Phycorickettsia trachydisci]